MDSALVLFSGGQDSTTCLAWALDKFDYVETVGFYYGQRHSIEMDCRKKVLHFFRGNNLGKDTVLNLPELGVISDTSLTAQKDICEDSESLPNTFIPGRNLLFLTYAAAIAYRARYKNIVGGMCETDYSGYPDCRSKTIESLNDAINLGMESDIQIHTPLMYLTKSETWELAERLGSTELVNLIIKETHTCYNGNRELLHDWGFGCRVCPACRLRSNGYYQYKGIKI